jgi:hypothetical protein
MPFDGQTQPTITLGLYLIATAFLTGLLGIWLVLILFGNIGYFDLRDIWGILLVLLIILVLCANVVIGIAFVHSAKLTYQKLIPNTHKIQFI